MLLSHALPHRARGLYFLLLLSLFAISACSNQTRPDNEKNDEELYIQAKDNLQASQYTRAIELYTLLKTKYPFSKYNQDATLELAYSYYKTDKFSRSISELIEFQQLYPRSQHIDYSIFLTGLISEVQSKSLFDGWAKDPSERGIDLLRNAIGHYQLILSNFPKSIYAKKSKRRIKNLTRTIDLHDLHIANFYLDRKSYIAALRRANDLIERSQEKDIRIEALEITITSYDRLNMSDAKQYSMTELNNLKQSGTTHPAVDPITPVQDEIDSLLEQ